jgi:hypothetical protein
MKSRTDVISRRKTPMKATDKMGAGVLPQSATSIIMPSRTQSGRKVEINRNLVWLSVQADAGI